MHHRTKLRSLVSVACTHKIRFFSDLLTATRYAILIYVTRSEKRVTKCPFGHSEILIPTERAINEVQFHISFNTVHNAKVKLWPLKVMW